MQHIVVGVDGSDGAQRAVEWALDEVELRHAHLELIHAWDTDPVPTLGSAGGLLEAAQETDAHRSAEEAARKLLNEIVARAEARSPSSSIDASAVQGSVAEVLLERTRDADLLVIGSLGSRKLLRLRPVGEHIAHHATCPIVIVPRHVSN